MYRPNFCSECAAKIVRLRWHFWTSRKFCDSCSRRLWRERLRTPLISCFTLLSIGIIAGRAVRPAAVPLIIERNADSPLRDSQENNLLTKQVSSDSGAKKADVTASQTTEDLVYICGARTKKGTPCSRRVRGPVRCWQHKGMPPMLPLEKLQVKD
jgi:hypothetical protein